VKLLCGWETDCVFERYLIRNEANLARADAKRFKGSSGKVGAFQRKP